MSGVRVQADQEWTQQQKRDTTAAPQTDHHSHSGSPDAASTLWGLECLPADLCRSLGGVSTCPSTVSDRLLQWSGRQDVGLWHPRPDRVCGVSLLALWA